jgi:hypothetical protein
MHGINQRTLNRQRQSDLEKQPKPPPPPQPPQQILLAVLRRVPEKNKNWKILSKYL